jgi:hypothetical protein
MLSKYLTRAVIDEILPPSFLSDAVICNLGKMQIDDDPNINLLFLILLFIVLHIFSTYFYLHIGGEIVDHAKRMLSHNHSGALLEHVWGPGDGRPVEDLKVAVDQLLQGNAQLLVL